MYKPFVQRAGLWGLWATNSLGALLYTLVFAALVFVPCFLVVDRHPRPWLIRMLRVLGLASLALIVMMTGALISSGAWDRGIVFGALFGVLVLAGAALGFFRAAAHGAEVAALRPHGDPVAHWSGVLAEHPRWWLRSKAARELGAARGDRSDARMALAASRASEDNRHVRRAIAESLARLELTG